MHDSQRQYFWQSRVADDGEEYWMCELGEYDLYVESEPDNTFSFSVTDKDGNVIRCVYEFQNSQIAMDAAEKRWKSCLKPTPGLYTKGQNFNWLTVDGGEGSECRIGMRNLVLLQTRRNDGTGRWSVSAYYRHVLLVEETDAYLANSKAQFALQEWYKANAVGLLHIHSLGSD